MAVIPGRTGGYSKSRKQIRLEDAAKSGSPEAIYELGKYFLLEEKKEYKAREILTQSAEKGHEKSILMLVQLYSNVHDKENASLWCQKALALDTVKSNFEIASLVLQGYELPCSLETAKDLLYKSIRKGNEGLEAEKMYVILESHEYSLNDIQHNDGEAQFQFAQSFIEKSTDLPLLFIIGKEWLDRAVVNGCGDAAFYLAEILTEGTRTRRNIPLAKEYYKKAREAHVVRETPNWKKCQQYTYIGGDGKYLLFFDRAIYYEQCVAYDAVQGPRDSSCISYDDILRIEVEEKASDAPGIFKIFLKNGSKTELVYGAGRDITQDIYKIAFSEDFSYKISIMKTVKNSIINIIVSIIQNAIFGFDAKGSGSKVMVLDRL